MIVNEVLEQPGIYLGPLDRQGNRLVQRDMIRVLVETKWAEDMSRSDTRHDAGEMVRQILNAALQLPVGKWQEMFFTGAEPKDFEGLPSLLGTNGRQLLAGPLRPCRCRRRRPGSVSCVKHLYPALIWKFREDAATTEHAVIHVRRAQKQLSGKQILGVHISRHGVVQPSTFGEGAFALSPAIIPGIM